MGYGESGKANTYPRYVSPSSKGKSLRTDQTTMAQDITAIIDGIKNSVEVVGRSGRDEIYLDNVSFRFDTSKLLIPHDSDLTSAEGEAKFLLKHFDIAEYELDTVNVFTNNTYTQDEIVAFLTLPPERTPVGFRIDMVVCVSSSDVTNELPQTVLVSELFLHELSKRLDCVPGRITLNIAYAYVLWDDVEQLIDPEEIEIPR